MPLKVIALFLLLPPLSLPPLPALGQEADSPPSGQGEAEKIPWQDSSRDRHAWNCIQEEDDRSKGKLSASWNDYSREEQEEILRRSADRSGARFQEVERRFHEMMSSQDLDVLRSITNDDIRMAEIWYGDEVKEDLSGIRSGAATLNTHIKSMVATEQDLEWAKSPNRYVSNGTRLSAAQIDALEKLYRRYQSAASGDLSLLDDQGAKPINKESLRHPAFIEGMKGFADAGGAGAKFDGGGGARAAAEEGPRLAANEITGGRAGVSRDYLPARMKSLRDVDQAAVPLDNAEHQERTRLLDSITSGINPNGASPEAAREADRVIREMYKYTPHPVLEKIAKENIGLEIVPRDKLITDMPALQSEKGQLMFDGRPTDMMRALAPTTRGEKSVFVGEETILGQGWVGVNSDGLQYTKHYGPGYTVSHEYAGHGMLDYGLSDSDRDAMKSNYNRRKLENKLGYAGEYAASNYEEYYAQMVSAFFGLPPHDSPSCDARCIAINDPVLYENLLRYYGPPRKLYP